jgi:D-alanine-D-alanine ligase
MTASPSPGEAQLQAPLLVWVLAPYLETTDPNIDCYSDYSQSWAEYQRVFADLGIEWRWVLVSLDDVEATLDRVIRESEGFTPVVFNLCDGDDLNGVPGVEVIRRLKLLGLCFTGADERFYEVTTSKIDMKAAFEAAGVPTPSWEILPPKVTNARSILKRLGTPLIVKPAVSAGSMGITTKSVVDTADALRREVRQLHDGYRGWNLTGGGVFAERFITGREFTTFITGSHHSPERSRVYPPVERVFHDSLPATEQFLSFDRLWEIYERETPIGPDAYLWQYAAAPADLVPAICDVSWAAYVAVEGTGYGRVDLRYDQETGQLFVLEVNAQCGISEDENITSIGAILRFANRTFSQAVAEIIDDALAAAPSFVPSNAS